MYSETKKKAFTVTGGNGCGVLANCGFFFVMLRYLAGGLKKMAGERPEMARERARE